MLFHDSHYLHFFLFLRNLFLSSSISGFLLLKGVVLDEFLVSYCSVLLFFLSAYFAYFLYSASASSSGASNCLFFLSILSCFFYSLTALFFSCSMFFLAASLRKYSPVIICMSSFLSVCSGGNGVYLSFFFLSVTFLAFLLTFCFLK